MTEQTYPAMTTEKCIEFLDGDLEYAEQTGNFTRRESIEACVAHLKALQAIIQIERRTNE